MYGLEKQPKAPFEFDLEKECKQDPAKAKQLLKTVEEKINEIKAILRQGSGSEEYDKYGILLHGYAALQKVLSKLTKK